MTTFGFIAKNALRNKRRATLSILSVAVSLFLFVILQVGLREITLPVEDIGSASRIIVRNRISSASFFPAKQKAVIERMPGVEAISPFTQVRWKISRRRSHLCPIRRRSPGLPQNFQ